MIFKRLLLCFLLLPLGVLAQQKTYRFSSFQSRNDKQQWGPNQYVGSSEVQISATEINLTADRPYQLEICSKTDLPDRGAIYLCQEKNAARQTQPVTVMITNQEQLYVYMNGKRFLIHFEPLLAASYMADTD